MTKKILIIEDDPMALRLTEYALKQRGYQVLTTCNGLEGIITAQKEAPDLVILDIMLPGIDGFEVCQRLRAGVQTAPIPILIISGKARQEDIAIGFKAGANDYLPKPATPATIIERVERLLTHKLSGQTRNIAFISTAENLGMKVILANVAAAIAALGNQVTLVDVTPGAGSGKDKAGAAGEENGRVILETEAPDNIKAEPAGEVLPSGVRLLHVEDTSGQEYDVTAVNIELLHKLSDATDYLLVDLPLKPTPLARTILSRGDLVIIASSCQLENIYGMKNIITVFNFLGIPPEMIAAVLVDPEGVLPSASLAGIRPYLESNLGIQLAGAVSFEVKAQQLSDLEGQPIIQSSPNSQLAQDITQIARYIADRGGPSPESSQHETKVPRLEKS